jgi:hypothetical protein
VANSNFNAQSNTFPVQGGYAQPSPGITEAVVTAADPSGNAYVTSLASGGNANLQTTQYRDSIITVNAGGTSAAPGIGATVATITPGTAGLWEVYGTVGVAGTAVVAQADSNNMQLSQSGTARVSPIVCNATAAASTNVAIPAVILNLGASDTVQVLAIRAATAATIYSAALVARRVG